MSGCCGVFSRNEVGSKAVVLKCPGTPNYLLGGLHLKKQGQAGLPTLGYYSSD